MAKKDQFAVIKYRNAQFKVSEGNIIELNKVTGKEGDKITFDEVLLKVDGDKIDIGKPTVANAKVTGEIVEQTKGKKVKMMIYKAKSRYRRRVGHRQHLTKIKINKIS